MRKWGNLFAAVLELRAFLRKRHAEMPVSIELRFPTEEGAEDFRRHVQADPVLAELYRARSLEDMRRNAFRIAGFELIVSHKERR